MRHPLIRPSEGRRISLHCSVRLHRPNQCLAPLLCHDQGARLNGVATQSSRSRRTGHELLPRFKHTQRQGFGTVRKSSREFRERSALFEKVDQAPDRYGRALKDGRSENVGIRMYSRNRAFQCCVLVAGDFELPPSSMCTAPALLTSCRLQAH